MATLFHTIYTMQGVYDISINFLCNENSPTPTSANITVTNKFTQNKIPLSYKAICDENNYPVECNNFANFILMVKSPIIEAIIEFPENDATIAFRYEPNGHITLRFDVVAKYVIQQPTLKTIVDTLQMDLTNIINNVYVTNEEIYRRVDTLHENQTRFMTFNKRDLPITFRDAIANATKDFNSLDENMKGLHERDFAVLIGQAKTYYKYFLQQLKTALGTFMNCLKHEYARCIVPVGFESTIAQQIFYVTMPIFLFVDNKIHLNSKRHEMQIQDLILHHSNLERIKTAIIADVKTGFHSIKVVYGQYCIFTGGYEIELYLNKTDFERDISYLWNNADLSIKFLQFVNLFTCHNGTIDFSFRDDVTENCQSANYICKILDTKCEIAYYRKYLKDV